MVAIELWNINTGELLKTITPASGAFLQRIPQMVRRLRVRIGKLSTFGIWIRGELLRTLTGHIYRISSIAFSPEGRTLTSSGSDGTLLLWKMN